MAAKKPRTVSLSGLSRAVDSAIKLAAARTDLALDKATLVHRWEIFGRRLRAASDLNAAYELAEEVTTRLKLPALKAQPAVARIGRDILVGFIDRDRLPALFEL